MEAPLVRLHSSCFTGDLLDSLRCDCGDQLHMALGMIGAEGAGALIYLPQEGRGIGLIEKIRAYNLQDKGLDTVQANLALGHRADLRDYGIGLQILKDLGLTKVRLLTNNPKKTDAFVYYGYDLVVVDQVPIIAPTVAERQRYLDAKRDKLGHLLPPRPCCGGDGTPGASCAPSRFLNGVLSPGRMPPVRPMARSLALAKTDRLAGVRRSSDPLLEQSGLLAQAGSCARSDFALRDPTRASPSVLDLSCIPVSAAATTSAKSVYTCKNHASLIGKRGFSKCRVTPCGSMNLCTVFPGLVIDELRPLLPLENRGRVEVWRGGLGRSRVPCWPALSSAGVTPSRPCSVSTPRSSNWTGGFSASSFRTRLVESLFTHVRPRTVAATSVEGCTAPVPVQTCPGIAFLPSSLPELRHNH